MPGFAKCSLILFLISGCANPAADPPDDSAKTSTGIADEESQGKPYDFSGELTPAEAKELIPRAASLSASEFQDLWNRPPVAVEEIPNQSLTAILLAVDPEYAEQQNPQARTAFRYTGSPFEAPDPARIREAVEGAGDVEFVSIIQSEYIIDCTCLSKGEITNGRVTFRAKGVFAGAANFLAQRIDDEWRIVEFQVPEFGLITRRQADGRWKLATEEYLLGVESL